jgi:hypothetical protein
VTFIREKKDKNKDLKYPKAIKAVSMGMALTLVAILGLNAYAGIAGYFVGTNITNSIMIIMDGGGGDPPISMTDDGTGIRAWMLFPVNNTGMIGFDITDLVIDVEITSLNSTLSLSATTHAGTIPFGQASLVNVTIIDASILDAMMLQHAMPVVKITVQVTYFLSSMVFSMAIPIQTTMLLGLF